MILGKSSALLIFFIPVVCCLKATNEQQDDGAGIFHQVARFPVDLVYLYTRHPWPSPPTPFHI